MAAVGAGVLPVSQGPFQCVVVLTESYVFVHACVHLPCGNVTVTAVNVLGANENASSPCSYYVELESFHGCGCAPDCENKNCGPDGCGGYCGTPWMQGTCSGTKRCSDAGICEWHSVVLGMLQ